MENSHSKVPCVKRIYFIWCFNYIQTNPDMKKSYKCDLCKKRFTGSSKLININESTQKEISLNVTYVKKDFLYLVTELDLLNNSL